MAFLPRTLTRLVAPLLLALPLALVAPAQAQTAPAPTDVIREITDAVGLKARFELRATREVDNAAAVVYDGKRYLLYNPTFLNAVNRAGHTDWAGRHSRPAASPATRPALVRSRWCLKTPTPSSTAANRLPTMG
ncbi:MAG: hypothetical protein M3Y12_08270, partial [Bacteroidota bacterium]|nr:hypothetical protein [Bacteroidota bacterium]